MEEEIICFLKNCHEYLVFCLGALLTYCGSRTGFPSARRSVGSQVKLFPSLNWRPGALEMRAQRLPVLWPLAFYRFNLCAKPILPHTWPAQPPTFTSFNPSYSYSLLEIFIVPLIDSSPSFFLLRLYVFFSTFQWKILRFLNIGSLSCRSWTMIFLHMDREDGLKSNRRSLFDSSRNVKFSNDLEIGATFSLSPWILHEINFVP